MSQYNVILIISGIDGKDGVDVPEKREYRDLDNFKCADVVIERFQTEFTREHKFCGTLAIQGTDGGNGGCGGPGGKGGEVRILGLKNQSSIVSFQQNGMEGSLS